MTCKLKPQGDILRPSEWYNKKIVPPPNAGKDVETLDHSYIIGGNINWYNHSEKSLAISFFLRFIYLFTLERERMSGGERENLKPTPR